MIGAICGGVISQSQDRADEEKYGVWANAMKYVLPDDKYELYVAAKQQGNEKEASRIFKEFAYSKI